MHSDEVEIDDELVRWLLAEQMPDLADLAVQIVEPWGTDNAIWRLGEELVVRLPRITSATHQIELEATWLPLLAGCLAIAVPVPIATGVPSNEYPFGWAVHRWIPGDGARLELIDDPIGFADDVADVIRGLRTVPIDGAPPAHNRARPIARYDASTRRAIESARHLVDAEAALAIWEQALAAPPHEGEPGWVHGDLEGNCLVREGRLAGLVDWGSACAGDPAVDVQVAWSPLFTEESRVHFLAALDVDASTIARAKGAAINQACAALPYYFDTYPLIVERSWHKLAALGVERAH